ncbi:ras gtpase-activating protein [Anaeramoeba flamelloides]|uniref:Ras gtpase-activating protein n=1 Tax=Anaeramoeba flamelloides TaxID=1746091 RepID=A0ABQ8ZF26_9EUKA|nr:ras gtpase-activating protein [Anaeramoeba flamelloides]
MIHLSLPTRRLLFRVSFHPGIEVLKTHQEEQIEEISPDEILLRWVNFQVKKSGNNIICSNFASDLQDCTVMSLVAGQLTKQNFDSVFQEQDPEKKSQNLLGIVQQSGFPNNTPKIEDILNKNEDILIKFLAELFLWKPSLELEGTKMVILNNSSQKEQIKQQEFKTTSKPNIEDLLSKYQINTFDQKKYEKKNDNDDDDEFIEVDVKKYNLNKNQNKKLVNDNNYLNEITKDEDFVDVDEEEKTIKIEKEEEKNNKSNQISDNNNTELSLDNSEKDLIKIQSQSSEDESDEDLDDFELGLIDKNGNELDDDQKIKLLKEKIKAEEEKIEFFQTKIQLETKESYEISEQLESSKEENATLLTFTNLSQSVMDNIDFLRKTFLESVTEVLRSCKGEMKVKLTKLINEVKEIDLRDSKIIGVKYSIQVFAKAFFGLLKTHKFPKFKKRAALVIKKNIMNFNPYDEIIMKEMFVNIMNELERNETIHRDNTTVFQSIDALFEHFYFINIFRTNLLENLFTILFESEILRIERNDEISQSRLKFILRENLDKFICGYIQFEKVIDGIYEFLKNVGVTSPRRKAINLINEIKKTTLGKTIRFIFEKYSSKAEKVLLTRLYNKFKESKFHDYSEIVERNKELLKEYLIVEDIEFLTFIFNSDVVEDSSENISSGLFYLLESLGLTLPFLHMIISQEILLTKDATNLFDSPNMRTQMIMKYSKLYGIKYLQTIFSNLIEDLLKSKISLEVDPNFLNQNNEEDQELGKKENLEENISNLKKTFYLFTDTIYQSTEKIPHGFRMICAYLEEEIKLRYPDLVLPSIGSFVFLRFFCPAIREPESFELIESEIITLTESQKRKFFLISTLLSSLAKGQTFKSEHTYLHPFNEGIASLFKQRTDFLTEISSSSRINENSLLIPRSKIEYPKRGLPINPSLAHTTLNPSTEETISFHTFASDLSNDLQGLLRKSSDNFFPPNSLNYIEQFQTKVQTFLIKFQKINEILKSINPLYEIINSQFLGYEMSKNGNNSNIDDGDDDDDQNRHNNNMSNNKQNQSINNSNNDILKKIGLEGKGGFGNTGILQNKKSKNTRRKFGFRKKKKIPQNLEKAPFEIPQILIERWKNIWTTKNIKTGKMFFSLDKGKKWFEKVAILKENLLSLFHSVPESKLTSPFVLLQLNENTLLARMDSSETGKKKISFRIRDDTGVEMILATKKKKEREEWIQVIEKTMTINYEK